MLIIFEIKINMKKYIYYKKKSMTKFLPKYAFLTNVSTLVQKWIVVRDFGNLCLCLYNKVSPNVEVDYLYNII